MKTCTKCGETKPTSEFGKRSDFDTLRSHCKECTREAAKARRHRTSEATRAKARRNYARNAEKIKATRGEWKRQNREKSRAHSAVEYAVKTGKLVRPEACEECTDDSSQIHGHHDDYSRQLEVRWLCPTCHRKADEERNEINVPIRA